MQGQKNEEIILTAANAIGKLEEISGILKAAAINIITICAYAMEGKALFMLVTSDNKKAKECLSPLGQIETREIIIVAVPNSIGQLQSLTGKLKAAQIDLNYIYGTATGEGESASIVFSSNNNAKALALLTNA